MQKSYTIKTSLNIFKKNFLSKLIIFIFFSTCLQLSANAFHDDRLHKSFIPVTGKVTHENEQYPA